MAKDKVLVVAVAVLLVVCCGWSTTASAQSLMEQCADKLQNVMTCLTFASGKADAPTKQCCDSVEGMGESNPACLCFVIQQIHNGSNSALKDMGVQESRLLALPSSCKLVNASISDCPRLLHLSPNSPDAAIFSSNSTASASSAPTRGGTAFPSSTTTPHSNGFKLGVSQLAAPAMVALSVFFLAFPSGQFTPATS